MADPFDPPRVSERTVRAPRASVLRAARFTIVATFAGAAFDLVIAGGPFVAIFTFLALPFYAVFVSVRLAVPKWRARAWPGVVRLAALIGMVLVSIGAWSAQNTLAEKRAAKVIAAVDAYRAAHGAYPDALERLVPDHLDAIPRPKPLTWHRYGYHAREGHPWLTFTEMPPFGVRIYDFEARAWSSID